MKIIIECFKWVAHLALILLTLLTFFDVTGRYLFRSPLMGSIELTELVMAIFSGFAIFITAINRGHIAVDVIFNRLSKSMKRFITVGGLLMGAVTWGTIANQTVLDGRSKNELGRITDVLKIKVGPFEFVFALGLLLFSLVLLAQSIRPVL